MVRSQQAEIVIRVDVVQRQDQVDQRLATARMNNSTSRQHACNAASAPDVADRLDAGTWRTGRSSTARPPRVTGHAAHLVDPLGCVWRQAACSACCGISGGSVIFRVLTCWPQREGPWATCPCPLARKPPRHRIPGCVTAFCPSPQACLWIAVNCWMSRCWSSPCVEQRILLLNVCKGMNGRIWDHENSD